MSALLVLDPEQRAEVFRVAEQDLGLPAHVLEKDFWVTYLLDVLFQELDLPVRMMFKGGTSLSKCYGVIERFSEDIDLALDREDLGFGGDDAPEAQTSSTKAGKKLKALKAAGTQYVEDHLHPALQQYLEGDLEEEFSLVVDEGNPDNILFTYPRCLDDEAYGDANYVKPVVLIETGTKAAHEPVDEIRISPLVTLSESVTDAVPLIADDYTTVRTLRIERTFWEKITFLHQQNSSNAPDKVKDRLSRHLYDIAMIADSEHGEYCLGTLGLLKDVAEHKSVYFKQGGVDYMEACCGGLRLAMTPEMEEAFRLDYERMSEMFYGDPPEFEVIVDELRRIEGVVNQALSEAE